MAAWMPSHEAAVSSSSILRQVGQLLPGERRLAGRHEAVHALDDLDRMDAGVARHDVGDRGGNHRLAAGQVFRRLGRADEARRLVKGEGHQRHVPAGEIGREFGVVAGAEPMDVGGARKVFVADLHHRADHHDLPVRSRRGHAGDEARSTRSSITPK
jgi:hypothetical protein